jgi:hypothetical protein
MRMIRTMNNRRRNRILKQGGLFQIGPGNNRARHRFISSHGRVLAPVSQEFHDWLKEWCRNDR